MPVVLQIKTDRWRHHTRNFARATEGLVPVIKGNGYGFGRGLLCGETNDLGLDMIAVGTYEEVPEALSAFHGDVMVLMPWRPFFSNVTYDDRVIHTVGRISDVVSLSAHSPLGTRVIVEGETSMERHGFDRHQLSGAVKALGELRIEGFAIHLPLDSGRDVDGNLGEAKSWSAALEASQLETTTLFVSHLSKTDYAKLRESRPQLTIRPRIGTSLWLGDLGAIGVRATVLDMHNVSRGERVGYRQRLMPRDGHLLIVSGGTSHGIGLEAPKGSTGLIQRGKTMAKGGLEAAGFALSPFTVAGKQRWFAEPPHMQASMIFLPASAKVPEFGELVDVAVRYTTASFDAIEFN